jgi:hypothetical protein
MYPGGIFSLAHRTLNVDTITMEFSLIEVGKFLPVFMQNDLSENKILINIVNCYKLQNVVYKVIFIKPGYSICKRYVCQLYSCFFFQLLIQ